MKKLFTNNGQLSFLSHLGLFFLGSLLIGLALFYSQSNLTFLLGTIGGILLIGFAGVSAKANTLGIKPFTQDPLGWRKAKESYLSNKDDSSSK
ncbi:MAG: hypothetical protein Q7K57_39775 [Burkholderiaceae bacterium]|nr:hypothetical protein [Burkholderiaceae bacterium]